MEDSMYHIYIAGRPVPLSRAEYMSSVRYNRSLRGRWHCCWHRWRPRLVFGDQ